MRPTSRGTGGPPACARRGLRRSGIRTGAVVGTLQYMAPEQARGKAEKLLQEAQGYKEQVIAKAEGEAKRFISVYDEYRKAKNVTKKRIYLETMEEVLKGMDKIVLDSNGGVVPYLPLNELNKRR